MFDRVLNTPLTSTHAQSLNMAKVAIQTLKECWKSNNVKHLWWGVLQKIGGDFQSPIYDC